ncbi:MAG: trigger factor [Rickettsiales bacterium]|jgi:trigger factor|nr:trigger factor [Rickettsiales bacterium]
MQFDQVQKKGLKISYKIQIDGLEIEAKNEDKYAELQPHVNIAGFRPGKVPIEYITKRWGEKVERETIDELVNNSLQEIIKTDELKLVDRPDVKTDDYIKGQDLVCNVECEVFPALDADVIDLSKVKFVTYDVAIGDKDVVKKQDEVIKRAAKTIDCEDKAYKASKGDVVTIDYSGSIDGEKFEGGTANDSSLELGSGNMIPGFEDNVIGLKVGDTKKFKVKFPKKYHVAKYQDVESEFDVTVKKISKYEAPKLDEDFYKSIGCKDAKDFADKTQEALASEVKKSNFEHFKLDVFNYIEEKIKFELPESLVNRENEGLVANYIKEQGFKDEDEAIQKDKKGFEKQKKKLAQIAIRRVKVGILLAELSKIKDITVPDSDVIKSFNDQIAHYPEEYKKSLYSYYQENPHAFEQLRGPLLEDKVVEFLKDTALLKPKKVSLEQFEKISQSRD